MAGKNDKNFDLDILILKWWWCKLSKIPKVHVVDGRRLFWITELSWTLKGGHLGVIDAEISEALRKGSEFSKLRIISSGMLKGIYQPREKYLKEGLCKHMKELTYWKESNWYRADYIELIFHVFCQWGLLILILEDSIYILLLTSSLRFFLSSDTFPLTNY